MTDLQYLIPWMRAVAWQINAPLADDLAQEGMIAAWRALSTHDPEKGPLDYWVKKKAKLKMLDIVVRRDWVGAADSTRKRYEPRTTSVEPGVMQEITGTAPDVFDRVADAYHQGEIFEALNELTAADREYVYKRFWRMEALPRHDRWGRIKPVLQEKLSHLSETPTEFSYGAVEKYKRAHNGTGMCRNGHPEADRRPDGRCRSCRRAERIAASKIRAEV